ncbi:MAG: MFS transporter [Clostridia bacterium]|nr:MFS transporter [Clostridia bacterium]
MKKTKITKADALIVLCWLVYTCSYIGKLSYNANINQIGEFFGASYSETGIVSTFFFFAYGIGQIVNGLLCKRYNIKYVIFASMTVGSVMNLTASFITNFSFMKYLWLINGIAMSFLWTSLIRLLAEKLPENKTNKSIVVMGTTAAIGTFAVYGMSSLFAVFFSHHITFVAASIILLTAALVWIIFFDKLTNIETEEQSATKTITAPEKRPSHFHDHKAVLKLTVFIALLALFAIAVNFTKDGLNVWTPDILSKIYDTPGWLSILLTLLLPLVGIAGVTLSLKIQDKTNHFILTVTILFSMAAVMIALVTAFLSTVGIFITVACLSLAACFMTGANNIIISKIPFSMKATVNPGKMTGVLNGFCYLGSTLSSYTLGAIADRSGWNAVFITLLTVNVSVVLIGITYYLIERKKKHEKNDN